MQDSSVPAPVAAATLVGLVVATACTTIDPYTREEKTSAATKGTAIGAVAGAAVGALTGEKRLKRAAIGAGIGALAGGAVGYYMDRQEAKLRRQLEGTGVSVTRHGDNITLNMPGNLTFRTDSASLNPEFHDVLDSAARVADEYEKTVIQVAGHTDSRGTERYNQLLSERRAGSVGRYLMEAGLEPVRVDTVGFGEQYPIARNDTADGMARNRRVELTLLPITR